VTDAGPDIAAVKAARRREALARRATAAAADAGAAAALAARVPPLTARIVAAYRPIRAEIDPMPLARAIIACGATLALPTVNGQSMTFRAWREGEPLTRKRFGIEEPEGPVVTPDLLLVPLLAFTRAGGRLGYGAGFYDRYIAANPGVRTIGLAYAAQECPDLPVEAHDAPLAAIATEREFIAPGEFPCG